MRPTNNIKEMLNMALNRTNIRGMDVDTFNYKSVAICELYPSKRFEGNYTLISAYFPCTKEQFDRGLASIDGGECPANKKVFGNTRRVAVLPATFARDVYGTRTTNENEIDQMEVAL